MRWIATLWLIVASAAAAQPFTARVSDVIDGDTLVVVDARRKTTVRLAGIDAPEKSQAYGAAARVALMKAALHRSVRVAPRAADDYGRLVAIVHLGDINLNEVLLRNGLAWEYSHHHGDRRLKAIEAEARSARRGLWAQSKPQPPWEFRKRRASAAVGGATKATNTNGADAAGNACGNKQYCSQMNSCAEAEFYHVQCQSKALDKDGDGVPCENLCGVRKHSE